MADIAKGEKPESFLNDYAVQVKHEEDRDELVGFLRGLCEEIILSQRPRKVTISTS